MFFQRNIWPKIKDFWFTEEREPLNEKGADFVQYHDVSHSVAETSDLLMCRHSQTLVTDLKKTKQEIFEKFKKNTKYEIRRSIKEGCFSKMFTKSDLLNNDLLHKVDKAHSEMFASKKQKSKSEYNVMKAALKANMLGISVGYLSNCKDCAYHVYILGNQTARLLHSISTFRQTISNEEKNAIGRLNRYLHYQDMVSFKSLGYAYYDWGGYSEESHLKSISDFKASFGGTLCDKYTWIYATSWIARHVLFKLVKKLKYK